MGAGTIVSMGFIIIGTAVTEKIVVALGKTEYIDYIRVGGISLIGAKAIGMAINLLNTANKVLK